MCAGFRGGKRLQPPHRLQTGELKNSYITEDASTMKYTAKFSLPYLSCFMYKCNMTNIYNYPHGKSDYLDKLSELLIVKNSHMFLPFGFYNNIRQRKAADFHCLEAEHAECKLKESFLC